MEINFTAKSNLNQNKTNKRKSRLITFIKNIYVIKKTMNIFQPQKL